MHASAPASPERQRRRDVCSSPGRAISCSARRCSSTFPRARLPEIAFAGRSNVGKSSLVNALTGSKTLARVSNTPGRTREINFFRLGDRLMLADLPGYGFARVSKAESERWSELIFDYLRGRPQSAPRHPPDRFAPRAAQERRRGDDAARPRRRVLSAGPDQDRQAEAGGTCGGHRARRRRSRGHTAPRIPS